MSPNDRERVSTLLLVFVAFTPVLIFIFVILWILSRHVHLFQVFCEVVYQFQLLTLIPVFVVRIHIVLELMAVAQHQSSTLLKRHVHVFRGRSGNIIPKRLLFPLSARQLHIHSSRMKSSHSPTLQVGHVFFAGCTGEFLGELIQGGLPRWFPFSLSERPCSDFSRGNRPVVYDLLVLVDELLQLRLVRICLSYLHVSPSAKSRVTLSPNRLLVLSLRSSL